MKTDLRRRGTRARIFLGVGFVALVMAAAILGWFLYRSQYSGEVPPNDYDQVSATFSNHLQQLSARNVSAFVGGYQSNATVVFEGNAPGFIGSYKGADNLNVLFKSILGKYANYTTSF